MQLKNVVLPAPFGPMTLTIEPFSSVEVEIVDGDQAAEPLRDAAASRRASACVLADGVSGVRRRLALVERVAAIPDHRVGRRPVLVGVQLAPDEPRREQTFGSERAS